MAVIESYKAPTAPATAIIVEKKSEFIAHLSPAATEAATLAFLEAVRVQHRTAGHNVFAYRLRQDTRTRYSDGGEPAKTAGLPVLSCIQHAGLFNCIIVVTRYFGGTLLGTGGLVRAYTAAANAAIAAAPLATVRPVRTLHLTLPYAAYEQAARLLAEAGARTDGEPIFGAEVQLRATLPAEDADPLCARLREVLRGGDGITLSDPFEDFF